MKSETDSPSRRLLLAGAAAIGATAVAAPVAMAGAPLSPALAEAIQRHKAAFAVGKELCGPHAAAMAIAQAPVKSEADLMAKLRVLMDYETHLWGEPNHSQQFGLVAIALDRHFNNDSEGRS
ncbi:hypothetical protein [Methylocystis sp.]|uniref:hypothetical protein n=1 Tax=Methylocystis sp. TaxID=1911079 RepID=UPI003D13A802